MPILTNKTWSGVYLIRVPYNDGGVDGIEGIFASKELAEKYIEIETGRDLYIDPWSVETDIYID